MVNFVLFVVAWTVMVFDELQNDIPMAFVIPTKSREKVILPWLQELKLRCKLGCLSRLDICIYFSE